MVGGKKLDVKTEGDKIYYEGDNVCVYVYIFFVCVCLCVFVDLYTLRHVYICM